MGAEVRVVSQKFFAKLNNGDDFESNTTDFSTHLKGGVLEELKAVFKVQIGWSTNLTSWIWIYDGATGARIRKDGLDFGSEGFSIDDTLKISFNRGASQITGDVISIKIGELVLDNVVVTVGEVIPATSTDPFAGPDIMTGTSSQTALKYKFGLIENQEPFNTLSKLTNIDQVFLFEDINHLTNDFVTGNSYGGNKAWVTGSAKVKFVQNVTDNDNYLPGNSTQEFQIEHEFRINPVYRDGEEDSLDGIDVSPLDIFNGNKSLKYVFETEFRNVLTNPNSSKIDQYDTQDGSVGYLDESYNGYVSDFEVDTLTYTQNGNVVDRLEVGAVTNVSVRLLSNSSIFSDGDTPLIVGHKAIIDSINYSNSTEDYDTTWSNESLRNTEPEGVKSGDIIKNYEITSNSTSVLNFNFDVDLTSSDLIGRLVQDQRNLLYYIVGDPTKTVDEGTKITGRIDPSFYNKNTDIAGLFNVNAFEQYPHPLPFTSTSTGFTNAKTFNESGMMCNSNFDLLNGAVLDSIKFDIAVFKFSNKSWVSLRSFEFDLSEQVIVNNIQEIEIDSTRNYVLKEDDIFNFVKITTGNNDGTKQFYDLQVGYKIPWQEWLSFEDAPTEFYSKENNFFNGLNQKASNYSLQGTGVNTFTDGDNGTFEDATPAGWNITTFAYSGGTPNQICDSITSDSVGRNSSFSGLITLSAPSMEESSQEYLVMTNDTSLSVVLDTIYEVSSYIAIETGALSLTENDNGSFYWKVDGYTDADLSIQPLKVTTDIQYALGGTKIWHKTKTTFKATSTGNVTFSFYENVIDDIATVTGGVISIDDVILKEVEYGIKVLLDSDIESEGIVTNYVTTSEDIEVYDYNKDDVTPTAFTCEINTYDINGIALANNIINKEHTELRAVFTPVVPFIFSTSVDFSVISDINNVLGWNRFAHGTRYADTNLPATKRLETWANDQAKDASEGLPNDVFINTSGTTTLQKEDNSLYSSTSSQITANENMGAFYGMFSLISYEFYQIQGTIFANDTDNDSIIYTIAFNTDELGVEHTLSLVATSGGVLLDINPLYDGIDEDIDIWVFNPVAPDNVCTWALVYDYGKEGFTNLGQKFTTKGVRAWSAAGELDFDISRSGKDITINVDWLIDGDHFIDTIEYDLDSNIETQKFNGFQQIGFGFHSQDNGGFKDVVLIEPAGDFYGILRMDKENSPSDFGINELSTLNEAPEVNLLTNVESLTEKKALLTLSEDKITIHGLIDTSQLEEGANYRFGAELRQLDIEE
jgi:hypothetical protein